MTSKNFAEAYPSMFETEKIYVFLLRENFELVGKIKKILTNTSTTILILDTLLGLNSNLKTMPSNITTYINLSNVIFYRECTLEKIEEAKQILVEKKIQQEKTKTLLNFKLIPHE